MEARAARIHSRPARPTERRDRRLRRQRKGSGQRRRADAKAALQHSVASVRRCGPRCRWKHVARPLAAPGHRPRGRGDDLPSWNRRRFGPNRPRTWACRLPAERGRFQLLLHHALLHVGNRPHAVRHHLYRHVDRRPDD